MEMFIILSLETGIIFKSHWFMKGNEVINWKGGFSQAFINHGKTSSRRGLVGSSLNLWSLVCVEGKVTNFHWPRENKLKEGVLWMVHWIYDLLLMLKERPQTFINQGKTSSRKGSYRWFIESMISCLCWRKGHKLSLAKGKQAQGGVLWVVPWIYHLLFVFKELWLRKEFCQRSGVRLRERKCYAQNKFSLPWK
jgi:hypothetical protein